MLPNLQPFPMFCYLWTKTMRLAGTNVGFIFDSFNFVKETLICNISDDFFHFRFFPFQIKTSSC